MLTRRALGNITVVVSLLLPVASASAQTGSAFGASGAVPAAGPQGEAFMSAPAPIVVSAAVERAIALGRQKKNANHALVLRDSGQGFANAMAALSTPRWQTPATKSGLWLEIYTPLSWVSQQAATATREYRGFIVVGTSGEKRYTVKRKHFARLPM